MRKILLTLWLLSSVLCCLQAQDDIAVLPGEQYVLRNVATGTYLKKDGTTTADEREADNWRVVTNDTIRFDSPEQLYFIHSDEIIMQMIYSSFAWKATFSPEANTTYVMPSETTPRSFKFRYRYMASTRYLNVEVDEEGKERLTAAHTSSPWNDWEFVPTSHPKDYRYRLMKMNRSDKDTKYNIAYLSHDPSGNEVWLSGWMAVPTASEGGECIANHVLLSAHYTMCKSSELPTEDDPFDAYSFKWSSDKPLMVEPDYLGCGISSDYDQPYCVPDIMAEECVDMLFVAHDLVRDLHQMDCTTLQLPTYGMGTSSGGSVILACQRYVETSPNLTEEQRQTVNWVRTSACAGCYNPLATFSNGFVVDKLSVPSVIPLLIMGMVVSYPDIFGDTKAEDYFSEAFLEAGIIERIRSHAYKSLEVADYMAETCGSRMSDILSPEALDLNSDLSQKLLKALGLSNVGRYWSPKADIVIYYHPNDDVVPYLNVVSLANELQDKCQGNFELRKTTLGPSHVTSCVEFFIKMFFGKYKE